MLISQAEASLAALQVPLAGAIVAIPGVMHGIFVPVRITRGSDGSATPTRRSLVDVKKHLEDQGWLAEIIFVDDNASELEQSLRASLMVSHSDLVRNAFLSLDGNDANVWIDAKGVITQKDRARLESHVAQFSSLFSLRNTRMILFADSALPTRSELLGAIRQRAPIDCEGLRTALIARGLNVPSLDWINRQFDLLRKADLVTRKGDRHYILTLNALRRLGTRKSRLSPDVRRLLALARGDV